MSVQIRPGVFYTWIRRPYALYIIRHVWRYDHVRARIEHAFQQHKILRGWRLKPKATFNRCLLIAKLIPTRSLSNMTSSSGGRIWNPSRNMTLMRKMTASIRVLMLLSSRSRVTQSGDKTSSSSTNANRGVMRGVCVCKRVRGVWILPSLSHRRCGFVASYIRERRIGKKNMALVLEGCSRQVGSAERPP